MFRLSSGSNLTPLALLDVNRYDSNVSHKTSSLLQTHDLRFL